MPQTKHWLQRALDPATPTTNDNETVRTATYSYNGKVYLVPTIRMGEDGKLYRSKDPLGEAIKKNDAVVFDKQEEADQMSKEISEAIGKRRQGYAKGGMMDETKRLLADGGMLDHSGEEVNGVEVPTGSLKEEVADDVPTYLSEGEFVFPADVVRYLGLQTLMALRDKAKKGLARMEEIGQVGNAREVDNPDQTFGGEEEDTSQFESDIDEIMGEVNSGAEGTTQAFAVGGVVGRKEASQNKAARQQAQASAVNYDLGKAPKNPAVDVRFFKHPDGRTIFITYYNGKPSVAIPEGFEQLSDEEVSKIKLDKNAANTLIEDTAKATGVIPYTSSSSSSKEETPSGSKESMGEAAKFSIDPATGKASGITVPAWMKAGASVVGALLGGPAGLLISGGIKLYEMNNAQAAKAWNADLAAGNIKKDTVMGQTTWVRTVADPKTGLMTGMGTTVVTDPTTGQQRLVTVSTLDTVDAQNRQLFKDLGLTGQQLEDAVANARVTSPYVPPVTPSTGQTWGREDKTTGVLETDTWGRETRADGTAGLIGVGDTQAPTSGYIGVGSSPMAGEGEGISNDPLDSSSWNTAALTTPVAPAPYIPAASPPPPPEPYTSSGSSGNYGSSSGVATGGGTTFGGNTTSEGGGDRGTRGGFAKGGLLDKRKLSTPAPKPKKGLAAKK